MEWLRPAISASSRRALRSGEVVLRAPEFGDYEAWADLRNRSRAFLEPWEPTWAPDELSRAAFRRRIERFNAEKAAGNANAFFIHRRLDDALMGGIALFQIHRGAAQYASLGYWMGEHFAGKGYMGHAVKLVVDFGFGELGLHRLHAACQPNNLPSKRVLMRAGFQEEGFAKAYLLLNGAWRDHLLFGLVKDGESGQGG